MDARGLRRQEDGDVDPLAQQARAWTVSDMGCAAAAARTASSMSSAMVRFCSAMAAATRPAVASRSALVASSPDTTRCSSEMAGCSIARKFFSRCSEVSSSRRSASSDATIFSSSTVFRPWQAHCSIFSSRNFWKLIIADKFRRRRAESGFIKSRRVKPSCTPAATSSLFL